MRQLCIALAVVVAGCGFEHGRHNGNRDASPIDDAARDAFVMIDGPVDATSVVADAMVDAPVSIVDTDGDTIADAVDNCPSVANTNQRNHDADARGDVCDRCPHLPSTTDPDGDADGVGDACDPRPSTAGDMRVLFEGFYEASAITGWASSGPGTWAVSGGVITQSSTSTGVSTIGPTTVVPRAAVTAKLIVGAFGNAFGLDTPAISISAGVVGSGQAYYCSASTANNNSIYATTVWSAGFNLEDVPWTGTFGPGSEIQLTELLRGTTESCNAVQGAYTATVQETTGPISGAVRLVTTSASASFDYLFIVAMGA